MCLWILPNLPLKMKNSENEDVIKTTWGTLEELRSGAVKDRPCENDNVPQSKMMCDLFVDGVPNDGTSRELRHI